MQPLKVLSAGAQQFILINVQLVLFRLKSLATKPIIPSIRSQPGARPSQPTIEQNRLLDFILQMLDFIYCTPCLACSLQ